MVARRKGFDAVVLKRGVPRWRVFELVGAVVGCPVKLWVGAAISLANSNVS